MRIRTTDGTFAAIQPSLALSPGSTYQVTFTVRNWVNGSVQVSIDGSTAAFTSPSAAGIYTFPVVASGSCVVQIKRTGGANCDLIIDDVICQLITTMPISAWLMDYVESSAATPASVDGPVGFLSDGSGVVGPNVIVNGDFSGGASNWSLGAGWSVSGGLATHASAGGASALGQGSSLVIGETYIATVTSPTPVAFNAVFGGTYVSIGWKGNVGTCIGVCTSSTTFGVQGGGDISFSKIIVQKLTGRHALQGTGSSKPNLRRGVVNLQTYSAALTNAAWQKASCAVTLGQADPYGGTAAFLLTATQGSNSYINNSVTLTAGVTYTRAVIAKAGTTPNLYLEVGNNGSYFQARFNLSTGVVSGGSYASTSMTDVGGGYYLCLGTWTAGATGTPSANAIYIDNYGAAGGNTSLTIAATGVFVGAITASQLLQCGGIPVTAGIPASSVNGNFGIECDGSKHLALPSVPFQMADDHIVIAGCRGDSSLADRSAFGIRSATAATPVLGQLGFTSGVPDAAWRGDDGVLYRASSGGTQISQNLVLALRKQATTGTLFVNGAAAASVVVPSGTTTVSTAALGGVLVNGSPGNLFVGMLYVIVIVKGALTDAEFLILRRFVAALTGPTGVRF